MSSTAILTVKQLGKRFGSHQVLEDVSFEVGRGEALAIVGESGSGKSTAARIIAGLTPPTSGTASTSGGVQMIFQDPFASLNPVHTIGYHLARPLIRHHKARGKAAVTARVHELLDSVGLGPAAELATKHPHQLSGGQRQRVAIARALATEPDLILADEPTSMLDASIRIGVLNLLRDLKEQRGIAIVLITHDLGSARYLADRTVVLFRGRIVEAGTTSALLADPQHSYTQRLIECA
ncbi:MAG TPA: ATP-binding cassette domain-containing protein [Kofleriaceae bacterium]